ncbi:MAG: hypothetical protein AVDCRST_MAG40-1134, partial [uncultured Gemmatimonadaceae bacterium]
VENQTRGARARRHEHVAVPRAPGVRGVRARPGGRAAPAAGDRGRG